jgi:hypothetical protein
MHDDAASLWLADVMVHLAECLAAAQRRDEARALVTEAQRIRAQHPPLAPHLVAPLENLAAKLRG